MSYSDKTNGISRIEISYFIILGSLVFWGMVSYFAIDKAISSHKMHEELINISGMQRTLSQKSALTALRIFRDQDKELMDQLRNLRTSMAENHRFLLEKLHDETLQKIYFDKPLHLDSKVLDYLKLLETFEKNRDQQILKSILDYSSALLPQLDNAVNQIQTESETITLEIRNLGLFISLGVMITLILETLILALPNIRRAREYAKNLENRQKRYLQLMQNATDGIHIVDEVGNVVECNQTFADMLGYTIEEAHRLNVRDWDAEATLQDENLSKKAIEDDISFETLHRRKNGETFRVKLLTKPVVLDGKLFIYASSRDISQEIELREQIVSEKNFISTIVDNANAIIVVIRPDGTMSCINKYGEAFTGYTQEEIASAPYFWTRFLNESSRDKCVEIITKANQGEIVKNFENAWISKNGEERVFEWSNALIKKSNGKIDYITCIGVDITERIAAQQKIEEQKKELEAVSKSQKILLSLFDKGDSVLFKWKNTPTWDVEYVSASVMRLLGYEPQSFLDSEVAYVDLIHKDDLSRVIEEVSATVTKNSDFFKHQPYRLITKNNEVKWIFDYTVTEKDNNGNITHFMGYLVDITEEIIAKEKAELASVAKSDFLSNMSHEIRTPLNGILGLTDIVLDTELNDDQKDLLLKSKSSSKALLHIINDILDYSKIEAGKLDIVSNDFNLDEVLTNLTDLFAFKIHEKGLEYFYYVDPQTPVVLIGDSLRLTQILTNLVGNAIKFTRHGKIGVHVAIKGQDAETRAISLQFSVTDSGIGISIENQNKLFQSFSQADSTTTKQYGGTGLGLAICKSLVELMGGEIWLDSEEGVGSSFHFWIPFKYQERNVIHNLELSRIKERRFLIVEDNEMEREYLSNILKSWGISSISAKDGLEALDFLRKEKADYLLLDWKMPRMDGLELLKQLKREDIDVPHILMVTAFAPKMVLEESRNQKIKIKKILHKPYTASSLYEILFEDFHSHINLSDTESIQLTEPKKALLVEDNEINQLVAVKQLKNIGFDVDIANNGLEGVEKTKANRYDVIFMDLQMPIMDGFEASKKIREFKPDIPIIALSAAVMDRDRELTREAGMNGHIAKPIDRTDLNRIISSYFETKQSEAQKTVDLEEPITIVDVDLIALKKNLSADNQTIYNMLIAFKNEYQNIDLMAKTESGEELKKLIHKIKGASGNLRIDRVYKQATKVEEQGYSKTMILELNNMLATVCNNIEKQICPLIKISETQKATPEEVLNMLSELLPEIDSSGWIKRDRYEQFLIALSSYVDRDEVERIRGMFESFRFSDLSQKLHALLNQIK